jgi:copper chaperone NosL
MKLVHLALTLVLLTGTGCGAAKPFPIDLGHEPCDHCHMTLADRRYTAELVTRTGRQFRFDDIGCLAAFLADSGARLAAGSHAWVSDYLHPDTWLPADSARYLRSPATHTPMASGLLAVAPGAPIDSLQGALTGQRLSWTQVMAEARDSTR